MTIRWGAQVRRKNFLGERGMAWRHTWPDLSDVLTRLANRFRCSDASGERTYVSASNTFRGVALIAPETIRKHLFRTTDGLLSDLG